MELEKIIQQAKSDLEKLHIPYNQGAHITINPRLRTSLGRTIQKQTGYEIQLSRKLNSPEAVYHVLIHEYLHTIPDCMNHGPAWKHWAAIFNEAMGTDIQRCADGTRMQQTLPQDARYILECTACRQRYHRYKACKLTTHPERYRCKCGGKLIRIR